MDDQATPHTYEQAAAALGIQAEAVRARLRRGALRRGPRTNDGRPTVLLSSADIATIRAGARPIRPESTTEAGPDPDGRDISALATLLQTQTERADAAQAALGEARERAARAEGEAAALRAQVAAERDRAEVRVQAAEAARDAVRAELEDWGRGGPIARAWRAFTSRRGR